MREILFRGKHIHALPQNEHLDGTWIYGYLCDENYINSPELEGEFLIDPETVCQYTGLNDKNGRKIFEGDVIRLPNCEDDIAFIALKGCNYFLKGNHSDYVIGSYEGKYFDVIGNIFDNPDLIGE